MAAVRRRCPAVAPVPAAKIAVRGTGAIPGSGEEPEVGQGRGDRRRLSGGLCCRGACDRDGNDAATLETPVR